MATSPGAVAFIMGAIPAVAAAVAIYGRSYRAPTHPHKPDYFLNIIMLPIAL